MIKGRSEGLRQWSFIQKLRRYHNAIQRERPVSKYQVGEQQSHRRLHMAILLWEAELSWRCDEQQMMNDILNLGHDSNEVDYKLRIFLLFCNIFC